MKTSATHCVLIPTYNTGGARLAATVREVLVVWSPVWVVVDGSTDGSDAVLAALSEASEGRLHVLRRSQNGGKGAAVLDGLLAIGREGYTHALVLDADGQHPIDHIARFMAASLARPEALVLGQPVFGPEVPLERLYGRKLSVGLVHLECLGREIADPLFGFRIYPVAPTAAVLSSIRSARRYDFDPEIAVRLVWRGVPTINLPAPCRYLTKAEGGGSHFHYLRDNVRMIWLHTRLIGLLLLRLPAFFTHRRRRRASIT